MSEKGHPIVKLNDTVQWLGGKYGVATPTCTQLRKAGATEAALQCDEPTRHLICAHMSHSQVVHNRHYEQIRGGKEAAEAHAIRQKLAKVTESSSSITSDSDCDQEQIKPPKKPKLQQKPKSLKKSKLPKKQMSPKKKQTRIAYTDEEVRVLKCFF